MGRLVRDDRKTTVTQITTRYNQGMQNTISECTTQLPGNGEKPFAQAHQNLTIEDWKNVSWSNESRFQMVGSEFGVKIMKAWIHPVSTVQAAGGVMVWGIFSWHTLGLLFCFLSLFI